MQAETGIEGVVGVPVVDTTQRFGMNWLDAHSAYRQPNLTDAVESVDRKMLDVERLTSWPSLPPLRDQAFVRTMSQCLAIVHCCNVR
jgi:hypothetical protein